MSGEEHAVTLVLLGLLAFLITIALLIFHYNVISSRHQYEYKYKSPQIEQLDETTAPIPPLTPDEV